MVAPLVLAAGGFLLHNALQIGMQFLANPIAVWGNQLFDWLPTDVGTALLLRQRELIGEEEYYEIIKKSGFGKDVGEQLWQASFFQPSVSDTLQFMSKEALEQSQVDRFDLDSGFQELDLTLAHKAGVTDEIMKYFWRAHWQQPSPTLVRELRWRNLLSTDPRAREYPPNSPQMEAVREEEKEIVDAYFGLIERPPYWRESEAKAQYRTISRVDLRRLYRYGLYDREMVTRGYLDLGYAPETADMLTSYTIVSETVPDAIRLLSMGHITAEELRDEIIEAGLSPTSAQRIVNTRTVNLAKAQRLTRERDLTKAEIIKGAKKEIITKDEAEAMLVQMGYDKEEAEFVLAINLKADEE